MVRVLHLFMVVFGFDRFTPFSRWLSSTELESVLSAQRLPGLHVQSTSRFPRLRAIVDTNALLVTPTLNTECPLTFGGSESQQISHTIYAPPGSHRDTEATTKREQNIATPTCGRFCRPVNIFDPATERKFAIHLAPFTRRTLLIVIGMIFLLLGLSTVFNSLRDNFEGVGIQIVPLFIVVLAFCIVAILPAITASSSQSVRRISCNAQRWSWHFRDTLIIYETVAIILCVLVAVITNYTGSSISAVKTLIIFVLLVTFALVGARGWALILMTSIVCISILIKLALAIVQEHSQYAPVEAIIVIVAVALSIVLGTRNEFASRKKYLSIEKDKKNKESITNLLLKMLPSLHIVERVLAGETVVDPLQDVTLLYSDLRGFTAMSTHLPAEDVLRLLDGVYE
jgi:hypothetical protein